MRLNAFRILASGVLLGTSLLTGCAHEHAAPPNSPPPVAVGITQTTSAPATRREVNLSACSMNWDDLETTLTFDCPK